MAISEWDQRQLCPDGACVGVIGPDGTCKVCGRVAPDWGDERRRGLVAADDDEADAAGGAGAGDEDEISPSAPAALGEMAEWQRRRLCPDGACIGVIGSDGRCKVCGKSATAGKGDEDEADEDDEEDEDEDDEGDDDEGDDDEGDEDEDAEEAAAEDVEAEGELGDRKLCPDGACIGVIGPDGRCKVCGKEAA